LAVALALALPADAAWPGIFPQRVDHRPANAPLGKGLELDAAGFVKAVGGINQPDNPVLDQVADVNRLRHRRRHAARELFHEGNRGYYSSFHFATREAHALSSGAPVSQREYQRLRRFFNEWQFVESPIRKYFLFLRVMGVFKLRDCNWRFCRSCPNRHSLDEID